MLSESDRETLTAAKSRAAERMRTPMAVEDDPVIASPMERMLDAVEWTPIPNTFATVGIPYATHEGSLEIGETSLRVYQLSNGQRIIDGEDFEAFFSSLTDIS